MNRSRSDAAANPSASEPSAIPTISSPLTLDDDVSIAVGVG